jgi:hypothetical protein
VSEILDRIARLDPIRSRDLDLTDAEMGYGAPHRCRWFNGVCIDCGRSWGAPRVTGEPFMVSPVRQDIQVAMLKGAIRG